MFDKRSITYQKKKMFDKRSIIYLTIFFIKKFLLETKNVLSIDKEIRKKKKRMRNSL